MVACYALEVFNCRGKKGKLKRLQLGVKGGEC